MDKATADERVLRITWFGHSTVLVELDGVRLLTDPILRGRLAHLRRVAERIDLATARQVDTVLVSHAHHDHLDLLSLRRLGRTIPIVVPLGTRGMLARRGFSRVTEVAVGDEISVGRVAVTATYADHHVKRYPLSGVATAVGYVLSGSARVYFAGDTDLFDGMRDLSPNLDVALVPISGWGPRVPAGHLNPERAAAALALLRPKVAVPIHWGTYRRFGLERAEPSLREPAETFTELAGAAAPDVSVRVLPVGGTLELPVASATVEVRS